LHCLADADLTVFTIVVIIVYMLAIALSINLTQLPVRQDSALDDKAGYGLNYPYRKLTNNESKEAMGIVGQSRFQG
jgi:hypothetical protein